MIQHIFSLHHHTPASTLACTSHGDPNPLRCERIGSIGKIPNSSGSRNCIRHSGRRLDASILRLVNSKRERCVAVDWYFVVARILRNHSNACTRAMLYRVLLYPHRKVIQHLPQLPNHQQVHHRVSSVIRPAKDSHPHRIRLRPLLPRMEIGIRPHPFHKIIHLRTIAAH